MTDQDLEQRLRDWYRADIGDHESAPLQLRAELASLVQTAARSRRPLTAGWTFPSMHRFAPIALAATAAVVAVLIGIGLILRSPEVGPSPLPGPTHNRTPGPAGTARNGWIAVSANPSNIGAGEAGDIYLITETETARRIIGADDDGLAQACPRFSPDGWRLAYGESRASGPVTTYRGVWPVSDRAVVVVGLNEQGEASAPILRVAVATDPGQLSCPEWSPDGRLLAMRAEAELLVADAASGETTVFPVSEAPWGQQDFEWSRDGSSIAVSEPGQIRVVRLDGGDSTVIPVEGSTPRYLSWTAADKQIAFVSTDGGGDGLAVNVVDVARGNTTQLTPTSTELQLKFHYPAVSPQGTQLAYLQRTYRCTGEGPGDSCTQDPERLLLSNLDGSDVVELQIPAGNGVEGLVWSPDGKRLLLGADAVSVGIAPGSSPIFHSGTRLNLEWSSSQATWQPVYAP
jgi:Tol biopolymer transport system component